MKRTTLIDVALLAGVVVLLHAPVLFGGETWALGDHLSFTRVARQTLAEALSAGRIPEWWDGVEVGIPFAANPAYGVAYPPLWLLAVLPADWGGDALLLAHLLLGALGCRALAQRLGADRAGALLAGGLFATSGYATSMIWNGIPLLTLAWTPVVAWAADRLACAGRGTRAGHAACLALVAGAQLLSGDPAGMVTSSLVAGTVTLARAPRRIPALAWLAAGYVGACAVGAAVLAPVAGFLGFSERQSGVAAAMATVWSLHPLQLVAMIWPSALGDPVQPAADLARLYADTSLGLAAGPSWATDHHVGLLALACAALGALRGPARGLRLLGAASLVLVLLALGRYTPVYGVYRAVFPPERLLRFPEKHMAGALVLWCALAGVGLHVLFQSLANHRRLVLSALAGAGLLFALAACGTFLAQAALAGATARAAETTGRVVDATAALAAARAGALLGLGTAVLFAAVVWRAGRRPGFAGPASAVFVLLFAGSLHSAGLVETIDRGFLRTPPTLLQPALAARVPGEPPPRVHRPLSRMRVPAGLGRLERVAVDHATAQPNLAASFGLADVPGSSAPYGAGLNALIDSSTGEPQFLSRADVRWAVVPPEDPLATLLPTRAEDLGGWRLVEQVDRRPRAFAFGDGGTITPCSLARPRPERLELDCAAPTAGRAVVLDALAAGWHATVDGAPAPVERFDHAFKAVRIAPGAHRVVFSYRTPWLRTGAAVSLAAVLAAALLVRRRRA